MHRITVCIGIPVNVLRLPSPSGFQLIVSIDMWGRLSWLVPPEDWLCRISALHIWTNRFSQTESTWRLYRGILTKTGDFSKILDNRIYQLKIITFRFKHVRLWWSCYKSGMNIWDSLLHTVFTYFCNKCIPGFVILVKLLIFSSGKSWTKNQIKIEKEIRKSWIIGITIYITDGWWW